MAPVIAAMEADPYVEPRVAVSGQHREMLDQVLHVFGLSPHHDLRVMRAGQTPSEVAAKVLAGLEPILRAERPDVALVQGDTITCFAGALAAFHARVPVAHIEAGLRTATRDDPFPEEMNRRLTTTLSDIHFPPTADARDNLLREGVEEQSIFLAGNTVIDALLQTVEPDYQFVDRGLSECLASGRRIVLVTTHRRENLGEPLGRIYQAINRLVRLFNDIEIIFPLHLNPAVRQSAYTHLQNTPRVRLIEPPAYREFANLLRRVHLVLTDSGGLQEEAPALGLPVLVLRETTERPEGVSAGVCRLVGTQTDAIVAAASGLLADEEAYRTMAKAVSPFGDGKASQRIVAFLRHRFMQDERPQPWKMDVAND